MNGSFIDIRADLTLTCFSVSLSPSELLSLHQCVEQMHHLWHSRMGCLSPTPSSVNVHHSLVPILGHRHMKERFVVLPKCHDKVPCSKETSTGTGGVFHVGWIAWIRRHRSPQLLP